MQIQRKFEIDKIHTTDSISPPPQDGTAIRVRIPGHGNDNMVFWLTGLLDRNGIDCCGGWSFVSDEQEPPPASGLSLTPRPFTLTVDVGVSVVVVRCGR